MQKDNKIWKGGYPAPWPKKTSLARKLTNKGLTQAERQRYNQLNLYKCDEEATEKDQNTDPQAEQNVPADAEKENHLKT